MHDNAAQINQSVCRWRINHNKSHAMLHINSPSRSRSAGTHSSAWVAVPRRYSAAFVLFQELAMMVH